MHLVSRRPTVGFPLTSPVSSRDIARTESQSGIYPVRLYAKSTMAAQPPSGKAKKAEGRNGDKKLEHILCPNNIVYSVVNDQIHAKIIRLTQGQAQT